MTQFLVFVILACLSVRESRVWPQPGIVCTVVIWSSDCEDLVLPSDLWLDNWCVVVCARTWLSRPEQNSSVQLLFLRNVSTSLPGIRRFTCVLVYIILCAKLLVTLRYIAILSLFAFTGLVLNQVVFLESIHYGVCELKIII